MVEADAQVGKVAGMLLEEVMGRRDLGLEVVGVVAVQNTEAVKD